MSGYILMVGSLLIALGAIVDNWEMPQRIILFGLACVLFGISVKAINEKKKVRENEED